MTMKKRTAKRQSSGSIARLASCTSFVAVIMSAASAQTASNNCGYNAGNEYPVGTSCSYNDFDKPGTFTNYTTPSGCGAGNYNDAWGWFTATGTTTYITYNPDNNHRAIVHVFTGACGSLTQVTCLDAGSNGANANLTVTTTIGTNYMIRVQRRNDTNTMNGRLCIWSVPPPPGNDDPCGATALTVGTVNCSPTSGTNVSATSSSGIPAPGCASYSGVDVWYSFVAPAGGAVNIETAAGSLDDSGMALYSATACGGTFTLIECDDDDGPDFMSAISRTGLTPGQTYYIRIWGYGGDQGTFSVCVSTPPANDEPCGAISLSLGSSCTFSTQSTVAASATVGPPDPGCGGYSGADVWYSFVAPSTALVTLRTTSGTLSNMGMAVYSATACNGTFTLIACDNTSGPGDMPFITLTPLEIVAGQTYYVRLWANGGGTGTFNLCANTAAAGSTCVYVLRMYDSQGDGWGGSNVSVQVGSGSAVSYTLSNGDQEAAYINVNTGDVVQLSYNAVGGGQSEISYILQLMYGPLYQDGPTPGTGLRYAAAASCQSPTASRSDCHGRTQVCGAQQINDNPTNTGLTSDLDQYNRGCLGSNERQGTWYSFTPSASGTLGFTIAPNNSSDDYDFAIWGPFTTLSCPPLGAPLRCNYSGTSGNTGLSSSGTNDSEPSWGSKWSNLMSVTAGQNYLMYISNYSRSGLAFALSWQLTNGASLDCLLPIELVSLYGAPVPEGIRLDWVTASESNSAQFAVERMEADGSFAQIGAVPAAGWSSSLLNYSFLDPQPNPGFNHYRLKLIDLDGTTKLSDVVSVMHRYGAMRGVPFPNPASTEISIDLDAAFEGLARISILDPSGRLVLESTTPVADGPQRVSIPLSGLEAGQYMLTVMLPGSDLLAPSRFVIQ